MRNPLVGATRIKIAYSVLFKDVLHVSPSENDDVIQTFASGAAKESFADRVHQWRLNRRSQYFHTCTLRNAIELSSELVVIIANDELGSLTERRDVPKLLSCPFSGWRASDTNVHNSPRIDVDREECEDGPEPDIVGLQEIAGPNCMVLQERSPSLAARELRGSDLGHMSLDRSLRNSDAKLQKFAAYSFRTPKDIFGGHALNECDDLRVNSGTTAFGMLRLPTPEKPKSRAVPTKHRIRLHQQQGVAPMWQKACEQNYETALVGLEKWTFDLPRRDNELLAKQGVLQQQLGPRASDVSNETGEHGQGT